MMRPFWFQTAIACSLLLGCGGESTIKPAEMLDESTGMTVGALEDPLEFLQTAPFNAVAEKRRSSFAYLGPIEWDQMGHINYGLWLHVAPGNDRQVVDIRTPRAAVLMLDDGPVTLATIDAPQPGRNPYKPVAPWGQSAYFGLNETLLKRMAQSQKLELDLLSVDGTTAAFMATHDNRGTLKQFATARGIILD